MAIHVVAIAIGSLPILTDERGLTPETWNDPIAQREFEVWSKRLTNWGIETTAEEFSEGAWSAASGILRVQRTFQTPFVPYYEVAGTKQRWRMFPGAVEEPTRLRIDVQVDGRWRTVYRMGSADEVWLARYFDRDRFRAALNLYAWGVHEESGAYDQFVGWLANRAAADFPDATRMRVGFEIVPAMRPGESEKRGLLSFEQARQLREVDLTNRLRAKGGV